ncbi:MAG: adenylyl-sulfate kinase [Bacteroidia bacterium]|nr:adenylyl-sulfate kinase [Bacteroidia bacterium]
MNDGNSLFSHEHKIQKGDRQKLLGQKSLLIWFTGLSGSGKSTLAGMVEEELYKKKFKTFLLDGDSMRGGLNKDLGFDEQDRKENIRRVGEVCKLFSEAGLITLTAFISPFLVDRDLVRSLLEPGEFVEVFVNTPLEICEARDPNGLYSKARKGIIQNFTGIDSPYEPPVNPELTIDTVNFSVNECVQQIVEYILLKLK